MRISATHIQHLRTHRHVASEFRTGVSLHSHTLYSEESLAIVPHYTNKVLLFRYAFPARKWLPTPQGRPLDFHRAFWTPPLSPRQAYRLEEKQIQNHLGLPALVSLTDHDDIRAGLQLHVLQGYGGSPLSLEWTVPFGPTFFHAGIHNIPSGDVRSVANELARYTAAPGETELARVLALVNHYPDVLVVLNHPLWDEKGIGRSAHNQVLERLLEKHGASFHALEFNGLRSARENADVLSLGRARNIPVVAGGDRHGLEPNAVLNLSRAKNFPGFVHEVRHERFSHIVVMPQYHRQIRQRIFETLVDILRDYPDHVPGRNRWSDRLFYRESDGAAPVPFSTIWNNASPAIIDRLIWLMRMAERVTTTPTTRLILEDLALADRELLS